MELVDIVKSRMGRFGKSPLKFEVDFDFDVRGKTPKEAYMDILRKSMWQRTYTVDGRYQCRAGAMRSAGDMWRLMKHYYSPDITLFEVMNIFHEVATTESVRTWKCCTVRKFVMGLRSDGRALYSDLKSEYGISFNDYKEIKDEVHV